MSRRNKSNVSITAIKEKKPKSQKSKKPEHDINQELFVMWVCNEYELSYTPKYLFDIFAEIEKGEYKNLTRPVPFEDLQDMWQRKMPYLKKVHFRNQCAGKEMRDVAWIKYDLAIILSKYDDYLDWKDKQKLAEINETETDSNFNKINFSQIQENIPENNQIDISDIIGEI